MTNIRHYGACNRRLQLTYVIRSIRRLFGPKYDIRRNIRRSTYAIAHTAYGSHIPKRAVCCSNGLHVARRGATAAATVADLLSTTCFFPPTSPLAAALRCCPCNCCWQVLLSLLPAALAVQPAAAWHCPSIEELKKAMKNPLPAADFFLCCCCLLPMLCTQPVPAAAAAAVQVFMSAALGHTFPLNFLCGNCCSCWRCCCCCCCCWCTVHLAWQAWQGSNKSLASGAKVLRVP